MLARFGNYLYLCGIALAHMPKGVYIIRGQKVVNRYH